MHKFNQIYLNLVYYKYIKLEIYLLLLYNTVKN